MSERRNFFELLQFSRFYKQSFKRTCIPYDTKHTKSDLMLQIQKQQMFNEKCSIVLVFKTSPNQSLLSFNKNAALCFSVLWLITSILFERKLVLFNAIWGSSLQLTIFPFCAEKSAFDRCAYGKLRFVSSTLLKVNWPMLFLIVSANGRHASQSDCICKTATPKNLGRKQRRNPTLSLRQPMLEEPTTATAVHARHRRQHFS